jgi:hypothetical protein
LFIIPHPFSTVVAAPSVPAVIVTKPPVKKATEKAGEQDGQKKVSTANSTISKRIGKSQSKIQDNSYCSFYGTKIFETLS